MNTPPCKDCITYAICKNSYNDSPEFSVLRLLTKCIILYKYFNDNNLHIKGKKLYPDSQDPRIEYCTTDLSCQLMVSFGWIKKEDCE